MTQSLEKTSIFWLGLIIVATAIIGLFAVLWWMVISPILIGWTISLYQLVYMVPLIVAGVVFIFVGIYMMGAGRLEREGK